MNPTFKALAALLAYPSPDLVEALPDIGAIFEREPRLDDAAAGALGARSRGSRAADLLDAQERYVALFDRGRATSLHLFEHVHGESRDAARRWSISRRCTRGPVCCAANELPDYLPVMLEYLSLARRRSARHARRLRAHRARDRRGAGGPRQPLRRRARPRLAMAGEPGLARRRGQAGPPRRTSRSTTNGSRSR